jgi:hypothetical protein
MRIPWYGAMWNDRIEVVDRTRSNVAIESMVVLWSAPPPWVGGLLSGGATQSIPELLNG